MNKKTSSLLAILLLVILCVVGCAQPQAKKEEKKTSKKPTKEDFIEEVSDTDWSASIMGVSGNLNLTPKGKGSVELSDGTQADFNYKIENLSDDGKKADIVISGVDIPEVPDGTTVSAEIVSNGLKLTYMGMSYVLKPGTIDFDD